MSGRRSLPELLAMSLVAALCVTLSAACAIRYTAMARDNYAMDAGICAMQDIADALSVSSGDMAAVSGMFPDAVLSDGIMELCFDRDFEPCAMEDAAYLIRAGKPESDSLMGSAPVVLSKRGGKILFEITASWQEGGAAP